MLYYLHLGNFKKKQDTINLYTNEGLEWYNEHLCNMFNGYPTMCEMQCCNCDSVVTHLCVRCKAAIAVLQLWRYNITIAVLLLCRSSMLFVFLGLACGSGWPWTLSSPRAGIAGLIHHTCRGRWLRSTFKRISSVSRLTLAGCLIKTYQKGARLNHRFALSGVSLFCLLGWVLHI